MREIFIPDPDTGSVYRDHQKVWEVVQPILPQGGTFLFRRAGDIIKIRVPLLKGEAERIRLAVGSRYKFSLLFNAVKTDPRSSGSRKAASHHREVHSILRPKIEEGFKVIAMTGNFLPGRLFDKPGNQPYRMRTYDAFGVVEVINQAAAERLFLQGIGKGKRMGYGMLDLIEECD